MNIKFSLAPVVFFYFNFSVPFILKRVFHLRVIYSLEWQTIVNDDCWRIPKKAFEASIEDSIHIFPGGIQESNSKPLRIPNFLAEIRNRALPNTKQESQPLHLRPLHL